MQYRHVERLVIAIGSAAILGSVALSTSYGRMVPEELISQVMLLVVLIAAARYGRRGGLVAAVAAATAYFLISVPTMAGSQLSTAAIGGVVFRMAAFGVIGVIGGELCMRARYQLAGAESVSAVDAWSGVFNQRHAANWLRQARSRHERFDEQFSVVMITLGGALFEQARAHRHRSIVRTAADALRNDVRMVDEVARLDDGRFLLLLPQTPAGGGQVVAGRCRSVLKRSLDAPAEAFRVESLGTPDGLSRIDLLIAELTDNDQLGGASGAYSDSALRTENPADSSTSAAPSASTFSTSTAASAEGLTKQ